MIRRLLPLALAAAALAASPASAAETLSYRLKLAASEGFGALDRDRQARRLSVPAEGPGSVSRAAGGYVAEVRVDGDTAARAKSLERAGARVLHVSTRYRTVTAAIPRRDLERVAGAPGVEAVVEVLEPAVGRVGESRERAPRRLNTCATGSQVSEGDAQLNAALARTDFELDGAGVKVGVLSDSFNTRSGLATNAAADIAAGELPGPGNPCGRTTPVQVLQDFSNAQSTQSDEGRAMAQIVHDIAPGADLAFATAFISETSFADNIVALKNAGADVIVDDVIFFAEPFFQDGPIANAVTSVTDAGVAYFSMAYNNNQVDGQGRDIASWEAAAYRPTACPAVVTASPQFFGTDCMDFDPGAGTDATFGIDTFSGRRLRTDLQWAEPRLGVATDFDLYLLNELGQVTNAQSHNINTTTQIPFENAFYNSTASGTYNLVIVRRAGSGTPRVKFTINNNGAQIAGFERPTGDGVDVVGPAIFGHNGTEHAQTVAAIAFDTNAAPELFSSRGPVTHYFGPVAGNAPAAALGAPKVLTKPDVTATNRTSNSFFGQSAGGGKFRFFGTSASAPHAAAVGALQLQGNPGLTPAQVKTAQKSTAAAIGAFGPLVVGGGLVDARAAVALHLLPPVVTATGPPPATKDPTPESTFSANRPADFTCTIDGGTAIACTSPFSPSAALPDGPHTLVVTATDRAGRSTASGSLAFTVDTVAPTATVTTPEGPTADATPTLDFTSDEALTSAECRFDAEAFGACTSLASHTAGTALAEGAHTFEVRGTDAAGNTGAAATRAFTIDLTAPAAPQITGGPTGTTAATAPTFTFSGEPGAIFQCRFDGSPFGPCSGADTHTPAVPLGAGAHVFAVRALDAAGNQSPEATRSFTVGGGGGGPTPTPTPTATVTPTASPTAVPDTLAPAMTITRKPRRKTTRRRAVFAFTAAEPLRLAECRLDRGAFAPCTSPRAVRVGPGRHRFEVRGTDLAGNVGAPAAHRWKVQRRKRR